MARKTVKKGEFPERFLKFKQDYPEVFKAYERLGNAVNDAGPLDHKTRELVRLAIAVGARQEGAVHSHTRRALEVGISAESIRHTVLMAVAPIGFPNMMAAMSWVDDLLGR